MVFTLDAEKHRMFQALLQGEDGLGFVRCIDGEQQLWTTSAQVDVLKDWLNCLPGSFNLRVLREYTWSKGKA